MRRSSTFALVALVVLLVVLLGSWVYLRNDPWPFVRADTELSDTDGPTARDSGDPFADLPDPDADAGNREGKTGGPLEGVPEQGADGKGSDDESAGVERGRPPEPVDTKRPPTETVADTAKTEDVIEAVKVVGQAGVRGGQESEDDLDAFVVSTLPTPQLRGWNPGDGSSKWAARVGRHAPLAIVSSSKLDDADQVAGLPYVLVGQVTWATLTKDAADDLAESNRRQAVVYLTRLPAFSVVVHEDDAWFALPMTEKMGEDFSSKGLDIAVHSPVFQIAGGFETITHKKDDGALKIRLELAPVFELVVDVTPPEAVADGVRVWVERLGEPGTPDADDSLYISAKVPSSGRLHFMIPEHYGTLTFGATGQRWHGGLPGRAKGWGWKRTRLKLNVTLDLAADPCDYVHGQIVNDKGEAAKARLQCTHFGAVTYAGGDGNFAMWVPFERGQSVRQFIVTKAYHRPEVIPLESRGEPTPGVDGAVPHGPWKAALSRTAQVELDIPKEILRGSSTVGVGSSPEAFRVVGKDTVLEVRWGSNVLKFYDDHQRLAGTGIISADQWDVVFKLYASGKDKPRVLKVVTLEDALKNR